MTHAEAAARYEELTDTVIALLSDELTPEERMSYLKIRVRELKAAIAKGFGVALQSQSQRKGELEC